MSTETTEPEPAHRKANRPAWWKVSQAISLYETLLTSLPKEHPARGHEPTAWEGFVGHWCMAICTGDEVSGIPDDLLHYAELVIPKESAAWEYLL